MEGLDLKRLADDFVESITLTGIPLPPSDNQQYKTIVRRSKLSQTKYKSLRVKSDATKKYEKQFSDFILINMQSILRVRKAIKEWNCVMQVKYYLAMEHDRLYTASGDVRKKDSSNYDKLLQDCLSRALQIDDSLFNPCTQERVESAPNSEQVVVVITPSKIRTLSDVYKSMETRSI